jgi:hypothetical protein
MLVRRPNANGQKKNFYHENTKHGKDEKLQTSLSYLWYLVAKVPDMSLRQKEEIFSSVIKDFSVTSFLRNDTVINVSKY